MARTVPEDAYFYRFCERCNRQRLHVDLMGDDYCTYLLLQRGRSWRRTVRRSRHAKRHGLSRRW
jgi:hypothetical protein